MILYLCTGVALVYVLLALLAVWVLYVFEDGSGWA
jgi:hypothetical protein